MSRYFGRIALVAVIVLSTGSAYARRPKTGMVVSPFGPLYNTGSPEYKMSGGNPFMLQQLMYQKAMMQQQQMLMKQQQMLMKQKNQSKNGKTSSSSSSSSLDTTPNPYMSPLQATPHRKKKRRTYVPHGATSKSATGQAAGSGLGAPATAPATENASSKTKAKP